MKKKANKIRFDMDELSDISDQIVEINNDFYIKKTSKPVSGSIRFPIPMPIKHELNLEAGMPCFFVQYSEGFYLSFNKEPDEPPNKMRKRNLASAGMYDTLYVRIPQFIQQLIKEPINFVKLIRTKGFMPYEWQIQFLSTDYTLTNDCESF